MLVILEKFAEHLSPDVGFIAAVARGGIEQLIVSVFVILMEEKRIEDQQLMLVIVVIASGRQSPTPY